jgi:type IV pilus modification protein PilV
MVSIGMKEDIVERSVSQRHDHRGFTLLETLVAVTILAFGLLAIVTMLDVSFSASTLSKNTTKATELAGWMLDRVRQDTSLATQPYTASIISLRTYDNKGGAMIIDTNVAADPPNEPGRTACQQWRSLLTGAAIANYMGADTMRGDRLPSGQGIMTIIPYDVNNAGNHSVMVEVIWNLPGAKGTLKALTTKEVVLQTVLATAE